MCVGLEVPLIQANPVTAGARPDGNEAAAITKPVPLDGIPSAINARVRFMSPVAGQQCVLVSAGSACNLPDRGDYVVA